MTRFLLTILFCCTSFILSAQYYYNPSNPDPTDPPAGNPGGLNTLGEFPVGSGLDASWTSILAPSQTPAWSSIQVLPFAFGIDGSTATHFKVSNSGVLTFIISAPTPPPFANSSLPSPLIPNKSICVWGLESNGGNDYIVSQTFGTAPHRQHWVMFSSYNYDGGSASCWTYWSIVLEESTNHIYIVDQRRNASASCVPALTIGIQSNGTSAIQVSGSPNIAGSAGTDGTDADNIYYEFIPGNRPAYDMTALSTDISEWVKLDDGPFIFYTKFRSLGAQLVSSFTLNYSVNDGPAVSTIINNVNLGTFAAQDFDPIIPWTPPAAGSYTIKIWASDINGNSDGRTENDTLIHTVEVFEKFFPRKVLHEMFTSSSSPACLAGNVELRTVLNNTPDTTHTLISYPMDFPLFGDPYYISEAGVRKNFYAVNDLPDLFLDGERFDPNADYSVEDFNQLQQVPSFLDIDAGFHLDSLGAEDKYISIDVSLTPVQDYPSSSMRLFAVVFEKLSKNNDYTSQPNGETSWYYYAKKMLPSGIGFPLTPMVANTPVGVSFDHHFTGPYRLPLNATDPLNLAIEHGIEEFTDLGVLVFVQDIATQEVLQSTYAEVSCNELEVGYSTLPDNGTQNGAIRINSVSGGIAYTYSLNDTITFADSITNLASGTYQLKVTDGYGCQATEEVTVGSNVGIDDFENAGISDFSLYPNPNKGSFFIDIALQHPTDLTLSLHDLSGKTILKKDYNSILSVNENWNPSSLTAGIYFMHVSTPKGTFVQKMFVSK